MKSILFFFTCICCSVYSQNPKTPNAPAQDLSCHKTDTEWKAQLDDTAYYVLRESGTERPFTGMYNNHYAQGLYKCKGCDAPL